MRNARLANLILSFLIAGIALWLYMTTAAPGIMVGGGVESETAQLQRVANRLGIAHSTGYPLHTLMGYPAARLAEAFDQNPYTWITYTSALAMALALVLFFQLLNEVTTPPAAVAGTFLLMVTDNVWHMSTVTETQALNAVSLIGLLWMTILHLKYPERRAPLFWIAIFASFGLANHRTSLIGLGAAGLAVFSTGQWLKFKWRTWAWLAILFIVPLVVLYGYLFVRVQDPNVVFSIRPTWFPSELDNQDVVDVIRGTLQSGEGLEGNMRLPADEIPDRWQFVRTNLNAELGQIGVILGVIGLMLLAGKKWRWWLVLGAYFAVWILFLMAWRLDWKSIIYFHALTMPLIMGLAVLAGWMVQELLENWTTRWRNPVMMGIFSLPLFWFALTTYQDNRPVRDLSEDTLGTTYYNEMAYLPAHTWFYGGGWSPDTFILLEYLDETGRQDIVPHGGFDADLVAESAQHLDRTVIITPSTRGFFGLYSGSTYFHDRGLAFSGTASPIFFQVHPALDSRLTAEAEAQTVVDYPMTSEIDLYSYTIEFQDDRIYLDFYWQANTAPTQPYSVFTHLRNYDVACDMDTFKGVLAQDDSSSTVRNMHPTQWWQAEEIVKDTYFITWDIKNIPDQAGIVVGMTANGQVVGELCIPLTTIARDN